MARAASTARRPARPARIRVGIGSWADAEYVGLLYRKGLPPPQRLKTYATRFDQVEVNATYYRTPPRALVAGWVKQTPADFRFDVKLHRAFSTSPQKMGADAGFVTRWLDGCEPLIAAKKLGAFLLVLPPGFGPERHGLEELDALAGQLAPHLLAVELRDRAWVTGEQAERTLDYFRSRKLVWVAVDMPQIRGAKLMPVIDAVTNPRLAYIRLHGRNKKWLAAKSAAERHAYEYPAKDLKEIAARVRTLAKSAGEVHVVANNHARDFAPKAALALQRLLALRANR